MSERSLIIAAMLAALVSVEAFGQASRTVRRQPGKTLVSLVQSDDAELIVVDDEFPHRAQGPASLSSVEWYTHMADTALVIQVNSRTATLSSDGDWLQTLVEGSVVQVLKNAMRPFAAGDAVRFVEDGGELIVKATMVTATKSLARPAREGRSYLVFASVEPTSHALVTNQTLIYEMTDARRLVRLREDPAGRLGRDEIQNGSVDEILPGIYGAATRTLRLTNPGK